ncbi:ADOP family duplicated permease [Gemmatimonadota bacterium]
MSAARGWKRSFRLDENERHLNRNVDEELLFHIETRIEQLVADGLSEDEARQIAEEEFGGIQQTRTELLKIGNWRLRLRSLGMMIAAIALDTRIAVRSWRKRPAFALTVLLIIALGIGASTTIFSVVDAVLFERLPYPDPDRLVYFDNAAHPVPSYRDWKARTSVFSTMGATTNEVIDYIGGDTPERLRACLTTAEVLPMLDARPAHGRLFVPDDFLGPPRVAVLSHDLWERVFSADPAIVGETVTLSDMSVVVVGILDEGFRSPDELTGDRGDVWLPADITAPEIQSPNSYILEVFARLKPGIPHNQAQEELSALAVSLAEEYPDRYQEDDGSPTPIEIITLQSALTGEVETPLLLLLLAVALLLAIACANVANLFLARGTDQVHEVGLRYAIGASRRRMVAQLLTESTVISLAGGILGIFLAILGVWLFETLNPGGIPMAARIGIDLRVLGFAIGISILTGILFGLAPALRAWRFDVNSALRDSSGRASGGRSRARLRNILLVSEIAFSLVLLATAGLLMKSFIRLQAVDPGFETEGIAVIPLRFDGDAISEETRVMMNGRILERLESVPGVEQVAAATTTPFLFYSGGLSGTFNNGFRNDEGVEIEEFTCLNPVTPGYFSLLGADLRGRELQPGDEDMDPIPVVISNLLAERLYGDQEAIGRTFSDDDGSTTYWIVGVVNGLRHWGLTSTRMSHVWWSWASFGAGGWRSSILVRTAGDPAALLPALRDAVWEVAPDQPITETYTMSDRISQSLDEPRFYMAILLVFALVAILLAAGGIYGSILYSVGQRRKEIGIRGALGAGRRELTGMILRQGAIVTGIGIVIGVLLTLAASSLLKGMVFGISSYDAATYLLVVLFLAGVAMMASFIPARRAARIDPVEALRQE